MDETPNSKVPLEEERNSRATRRKRRKGEQKSVETRVTVARTETERKPLRVDTKAREKLASAGFDRRAFLRNSALGAGLFAVGASVGYGSGYAKAVGESANTQTVITDKEISARVIAGVRIATEFIPDPVPAGTDADPFPGSAIQAALDDGLAVYVPSGTWRLSSTISRPVDNVTIMGAGKSTKLLLDGVTPCITSGAQSGWLIGNLAVDGGGVDISSGTACRLTDVWVNGVLTDNRPIGVGGGGSAGYYGVRAEDYITSGDGSPSNPYNASAIQSAINALSSRGGVVFIKSGIWRGATRINVNANGNADTKKVIFRGEGTWPHQIYGDDPNSNMMVGTHVQAGFDCYIPCDFYDMAISPTNRDMTSDGINFINDPTKYSENPSNKWTQGLTVKRVKFKRCNVGIRFSGQNMGSTFYQAWGVWVEQCGFIECNQGVRCSVADVDSTAPSQGFRGVFTNNEFRGNAGRAFDYDFSSSTLEFSNTMLEGCGSPTGDYALYINTYGDGGVIVSNVDFGDGSASPKDARIFIGRNGYVNGLFFGGSVGSKDIDIGGRGYFRISALGSSSRFNLVGAIQMVIEESPGNYFALGTVDAASQANAGKIRIRPATPRGLIGSALAGSSPYTYTNLDMCDEVVHIVGGTLSDVSRDGQSLGTERTHVLAPGGSVTISYSAAPTIKRYALS